MFPGRHMLPWKHSSIQSTRSPIIFPAASSTKMGVIVSKLTTMLDACASGCVEVMYCWRILNWIPLSRSWANLKGKLIFVKCYNIIKLLLNNTTAGSISISLHRSVHPSIHQSMKPFGQPPTILFLSIIHPSTYLPTPFLEPVCRTKLQIFPLNVEHFDVIRARSKGT